MAERIRGDRLAVLRMLIEELSNKELPIVDEFVFKVRPVADTHRAMGDPNSLGDAIDVTSNPIDESVYQPK